MNFIFLRKKYSLKFLFGLVVLSAVIGSLLHFHSSEARQQRRSLRLVAENGGSYSLSDGDESESSLQSYFRTVKLDHVTCSNIPEVDANLLASLKYVKRLECRNNGNMDIESLAKVEGLEVVDLHGSQLLNLDWIREDNRIWSLDIGATGIEDVSGLRLCKKLKFLFIDGSDLESVALDGRILPNVELVSGSSVSLMDLRWLKGTHLSRLDLDNAKIQSLKGIEEATSLVTLEMRNCGLLDFPPLGTLKSLQSLDLSENPIGVLPPRIGTELPELRELYLGRTRVADLTPLAKCGKLEWLILTETPVSSFEPLVSCNKLEWVQISNSRVDSIPSSLKDILPFEAQ